MSDVKALRALHETWKGYEALHGDDVHPDYRRELADALVEAAPDLLTLAEAVRDLAGPIAMLVEHGDIAERDAARRVLAILEPPRAAGDGR